MKNLKFACQKCRWVTPLFVYENKLVKEWDFPIWLRLWITGNVLNSVHFIAQTGFASYDLNISWGVLVFILCSLIYVVTSQKHVATNLHYMNHKGPQFQKHILSSSNKEKKVTYILDGLRVSKLTSDFHFWVNCPFKTHYYVCQHCQFIVLITRHAIKDLIYVHQDVRRKNLKRQLPLNHL